MNRAFRVCVGSANAAKLEAVRLGLEPFFETLELAGAAVPSGVPEQPIGFAEIIEGARNRARAAYERVPGACDLGAGLEDGLVPVPQVDTAYLNLGCCVLYDGRSESVGFSAGFEYPPGCVAKATAAQRRPIGAVFDEAFAALRGEPDPGPGAGNIGRLTRGVLPRAHYGAQAVTCAMVRRLHPSLYMRDKADLP
jgi:inosine/xanthosine triphosphatase